MAREYDPWAQGRAPGSTTDDDVRVDVGWTGVATAMHSILQISTPMFLRLGVAGYQPILIDFRHHSFECDTSLALLPSEPSSVSFDSEPAWTFGPSLFPLPGRSLDQLLWSIGLLSFRDLPASWLNDTDRYRLTRWPNFPQLEFTAEQMTLTAVLASRALTAFELADAARSSLGEAQRVVNALSLMGVLTEQPTSTFATSERVSFAPPAPLGVVARLRDRFGW